MKFLRYLVFCVWFAYSGLNAQTQYQSATIGFYNCENLFDIYPSADLIDKKYPDTSPKNKRSMPEIEAEKKAEAHKSSPEADEYEVIVDYQIINDEFTPEGKKNFTQDKYEKKLQNLSEIISELGTSISMNAPVVMGLVEVENRQVIEDLINQPSLKKYHYGIVHYNSQDARGIDVALIYQKGRFQPISSEHRLVKMPAEPDGEVYKTRDILRVSGLLDGENFTFLVNHWPSRRGGEKASAPKRAAAAELLKALIEETKSENPNEKIIAMGDFNDDPVSPSIKKVLGAKSNKRGLKQGDMYSPMESMYKNGMGTLAYRDSWNLFDLIFLSENLVDTKESMDYKLYKTEIYSPSKLIAKEGQFKGYPRRLYGGDTFDSGGYSDHFPVFSVLIKKI